VIVNVLINFKHITMESKFGIFLVNGDARPNGAQRNTVGISKLLVQEFDTPEEAKEFLEKEGINAQYLILEYWT